MPGDSSKRIASKDAALVVSPRKDDGINAAVPPAQTSVRRKFLRGEAIELLSNVCQKADAKLIPDKPTESEERA